MSQAHNGSRLISEGSLKSIDQNTSFLAHYDITENDVLRGIAPISNVITMREGVYGGGIAIEEATTNIFPLGNQKFNSGFSMYSGCVVTVTQNQSVAEWQTDSATRIQTSGGGHVLKYLASVVSPSVSGNSYTGQCKIKNIGTNSVKFRTQIGNSITVAPNESVTAICTGVGNGTTNLQFRFEALNIADNLDFIAYQPQVEQKAFATSFTETTRAIGVLSYKADCINTAQGTISYWYKPHYPSSVVIDQPTSPMMMQIGSYHSNSSFTLWNYINNFNVYVKGISSASWTGQVSYPVTFTQDVWTMITVTWNDKAWKVYKDGVFLGTFNSSESLGPIAGSIFYVGGAGSGIPANGVIDELRIDTVERNAEEILSWYISSAPFFPRGIYTIAY